MELVLTKACAASAVETFAKQAQELNLIYYASDAANEMEFEDGVEFHEAVRRAMQLCFFCCPDPSLVLKKMEFSNLIYKQKYFKTVFITMVAVNT